MDENIKLIIEGCFEDINANKFPDIALSVFLHQYTHNEIYRSFVDLLQIKPENVLKTDQIPFLPVSFFKTHKVKTGKWNEAKYIFESSGTTGDEPARHYVYDDKVYEASLLYGFRKFYGEPQDYTILALLPSYLERKNASLVHMAKVLIEKAGNPNRGFTLMNGNNCMSYY